MFGRTIIGSGSTPTPPALSAGDGGEPIGRLKVTYFGCMHVLP